MDLELHQLDRRYEPIRRTSPTKERQLLASLAIAGQQTPVVVVGGADDARFVLVDGYKRVRVLTRLQVDLVRATRWALAEPDALILERLMRTADGDGPLDQGWLLRELRDRFGLTAPELARRFARSASWVSRRLALVAELPEEIQEHVRRGRLGAHAAMRFLVPMARANAEDCVAFARAIAPLDPSTRQVEALCVAFASGSRETRQLILSDPALVLRAREESRRADAPFKSPAELLLGDLGALGGVARRADRRLREGFAAQINANDRDEIHLCLRQAKADVAQLFTRFSKEMPRARSDDQSRDPQAP